MERLLEIRRLCLVFRIASSNLLLIAVTLFFVSEKKESERDKKLKEEALILNSVAEKTALKGVGEIAMGIHYDKPIETG